MTPHRTARTAVLAALMTIVIGVSSACSSEPHPDSQVSTPPTATVTQQAPSVWAPATSTADETAPAADSDGGASSTTDITLPGLSAGCTGAIRAQQTVADLFAAAMQSPSPSEQASVPSSPLATTISPGATDADAPTSAPSVDVGAVTALTAAQITDAFATIGDSAPASLAEAFGVLHDAATSMVGAKIGDIPTILSSDTVSEAMDKVNHYIASCTPTTSS